MNRNAIASHLKITRNALIAAGALCAGSVLGGTVTFDFNSDPNGILNFFGAAYWVSSGGAGGGDTNGYLSITDAGNGQRGVIIFDDFDSGQVVKAFTFEADLRIGNGTQNPADGFSVNYARANDPVFADNGASWAQGQNCEANLPEEGTRTGIAIGFDAWDSGGTAGSLCDVASQSIGVDVAALTVRVDNILVGQFPLPTRNGSCTDATSLQTGPYDANNPNSPDGLCWAKLKVDLAENGQLSVWWKGKQLLTNYQTTYFPSPGRLVFGGRTGDANQNQHVDNIKVTTIPATLALVGAATGHPLGFSVAVNDSGNSMVDTTKAPTLKLNGTNVTATSFTKTGGESTITYRGAGVLTPGATNSVECSVKDTNGNTISGSPTFVTPAYLSLPSSYKVASVNTSAPGFVVKPYKTEAANPNRLYWTDQQLLGMQGPNLATKTSVDFTGMLDFSNTTTPGSNGQFPNDATWDVFGIPTADPDSNNSSIEATAYAYFSQAGLYTFGGNSDDGIRLTFAPNSQDLLGLEVPGMTADAGRGIAANQNTGYVWITDPGYYGFRFIFENGTGGCDLEFYTKSTPAATANILVNAADAGALKVYRTSTVAPPYVSYADPVLMHPGVGGGQNLTYKITDASTTVAPAGVSLKIDGVAQIPTITKSGNVTTVVQPSPLQGWTVGDHIVSLSATDSAGVTRTAEYKMVVNAGLIVLDASTAAPLGSQVASKPGFSAKITQTERTGSNEMLNRIYVAEQLLNGYWGPNMATTNKFDAEGPINYDINGGAQGNFTSNNGYPEEVFPGIPGTGAAYTTETFAVEFKTWLEFTNAGVYLLNFSSDDGFQGSLAATAPATVDAGQLEITAPTALAGGKATIWGNAAGIDIVSNSVPVTGKIVQLKTGGDILGCGATADNPAALIGNIAIVERGTCEFSAKVKAAYEAGAKAVVIATSRPEVSPGEGWFPTEAAVGAAGRFPIPVVMIARDTYMAITNALRSGEVTGTLHPWIRPPTPIWEADLGKGASDVNQYIRVTQPGLYPFRIIYWQSGGGGNAEFEVTGPSGVRALINDTTSTLAANSIRAFREVNFVPVTRPNMTLQKQGAAWKITYTGTLQSATTANGNYTDVPGATSPYTIDTSIGAKFYRARN